MEAFLNKDQYVTDGDKRVLLDKLFLNTRWYFIKNYIDIMIKARKLVVSNSYNNSEWAKSSLDFIKATESCGGKLNVYGLDNIRNLKEPVVYISNHMSVFETFAFPVFLLMNRDVSFVVKESLTTNKLFGPIMKSTNPIVVKRENPRDDFQKVMSDGKKLLENGTSIVIFPQATRSIEFKPDEFNSLGVKLAKSANVKVVPIAIKTDFWKCGKILKDLGSIDRKLPIYIKFGEPISIERNGKAENERIKEFIIQNLNEWGKK